MIFTQLDYTKVGSKYNLRLRLIMIDKIDLCNDIMIQWKF